MKLKLFFAAFIFLFVFTGRAQAPAWQWAKNGTGSDYDAGQGICTDAAGNVLVTGQFRSASLTLGSATLSNAGSSPFADVFIAKYTNAGSILWAKSMGNNGDDGGNAVCADAAGNVIVTGFFQNTVTVGSTTLATNGFYDFFVTKYDASGNVLWSRSAGGADNDYGSAVAVDASGNIFVTGYFYSNAITVGSTTLTNTSGSNNDVFIVKYDPAGNLLWARKAGGAANDYGFGICTDINGNAFVAGSYQSSTASFGSLSLANVDNTGTTNDIFVAKYDASGNVQWVQSGTGTSSDDAYAVTADAAGNVYVTGGYQSPVISFSGNTRNNVGGLDFFVVKYDGSGNVLWTKASTGLAGNNELGSAICTNAIGNVIITGSYSDPSLVFSSYTLTNAVNTGIYTDIFLAEYDPNGNVVWAIGNGSSSYDMGSGVCADGAGNIFVTGSFQSPSLALGSTTLGNTSSSAATPAADLFVGRLKENLSVVGLPHENNPAATRIYPNPCNAYLQLQSATALHGATLTLYNALGQAVKQVKNISGHNLTLQRDELIAGVYLLQLTQGAQLVAAQKVIITD